MPAIAHRTFRRDSSFDEYAQTRRESADEKAGWIVQEELDKLGWTAQELVVRSVAEAGKVRRARRLRAETSVTWKWIAGELRMGTWTQTVNRLAK